MIATEHDLREAIDTLAAATTNGELLACTDPAGLLSNAAEELTAMRKQLDVYKAVNVVTSATVDTVEYYLVDGEWREDDG